MLKMLGKLFGGEAAIEGAVSGGLKLLDEAFYTESERAEDRQAARDKALAARERLADRTIEWIAASQGQSLARRLIALAIVFTWLGLWVAAVLLSIAGVWAGDPGVIERIKETAELCRSSAMEITTECTLILGYYFAAPYLDRFIPEKKGAATSDAPRA